MEKEKAVIVIPEYMIYIIPIIAVVWLHLLFGRIEGFISERLMEYGGPPLQGLPERHLSEYGILIWVLLYPLFLFLYPFVYWLIEKNKVIAGKLFLQEVGLFILAGALEDWAVFAWSPVLSLNDPGSVFVNEWNSPTFNIFGNPVPIVYPIFLAIAVGINYYVLKDHFPAMTSDILGASQRFRNFIGASQRFRNFKDLTIIELARHSKQLVIVSATCQKCNSTFNEQQMENYISSQCPNQNCGGQLIPQEVKIL